MEPVTPSDDLAEIILYATPTGRLAAVCDAYFAAACRLGATTAQTYPPHCTLTGFFHRRRADLPRIADEVRAAVGEVVPVPAPAVDLVALHTGDDWVGLELRSQLFLDIAARFAQTHRRDDDEDAVRLKDWMHLSLAYGPVDDMRHYTRLATGLFDHMPPRCEWEIALWEHRRDRSWHRLT